MVRTMTRAEYEMEFGIAPVLPTVSNMDTTPAPRRMTQQEYNEEFGTKQNNFLSSTEPSFKASMGGANSIAPNLAKTVGNIPSSARNLARFTAEPVNPLDLDSPMNIGSNLSKSGFAIKDIFKNRGLGGGLKDIAGGFADTAKKGYNLWKGAGEAIYSNLEKNTLGTNSTSGGVGTSIAEGVSEIAKLGIEDPLLIPSLAYGGKSITTAGKTTDAISDLARPFTRGADTSVKNISSKVRTARAANTSKAIEEELYNIENNYSKTRKLNEFQPDAGSDSRKRISETDVLVDSVDNNGVIRTKGPGGAVEKYRAQTIAGKEAVVRENLVREGAKVNLAEIERDMAIEMDKIFEGEDLVTALNGIKKELAGLKMRADEFGDVPLEKVHDAKINTTRHIDYNTPAETKTYRKAKARVYKQVVEDKSKIEIDVDGKKVKVRDINKELGKYYKDIEHLEMLDGKRVKGGKLGKYTAQITGNIVGGAIGGAVGGLPGTAIGAIVGGETSSFLKGRTLSGTFGKDRGMPIGKNAILEKASLEGKLPSKVDLTKPSVKVGAKADVPKTPQISKLEGQIAKNVEAQKAAIKAGNFTLVSKLKEVYKHLVEKLKTLIKELKEVNPQKGAIKNPFVQTSKSDIPPPKKLSQSLQASSDTTTKTEKVQEIDDLTKREMNEAVNYIDEHVIGKIGEYNQKIEENIGYLADKFGIKSKDYKTIANKLEDLMENTKTVGGDKKVLIKNKPTPTKTTDGKFSGSIGTYKGEKDLTTKILRDLEGKSTVSKQYILDATNRPELKQSERDLIRQVLETEGDTVKVADFAKKVKSELLPLKVKSSDVVNAKAKDHYASNYMVEEGGFSTKYDNVALPDELRGKVANYKENIYESPIATSAGDTHFNYTTKNYFGHTRIEDMADNKTRRVIEVQSDLYQKGNLEREGAQAREILGSGDELQKLKNEKLDMDLESYGKDGEGMSEMADPEGFNQRYGEVSSRIKQLEEGGSSTSSETNKFIRQQAQQRTNEIAKLQQYNDPTAHFRMVREEIKKAAQDGKTKLQFPTGETALKIEGLGENTRRWFNVNNNELTPQMLHIGNEVQQGLPNMGDDRWIITDVLGDGKFVAVPRRRVSDLEIEALKAGQTENLSFGGNRESFDISGKVDTNNPIYKFYEKDVQKYLNKFGGKRVVDDKGVSWVEVPIKKEWAKMPVEAFALVGGVGLAANQNK